MERNRSSKAKGRAPRQNSRNLNGNARRSGGSIPPLRTNVVKHHRFRFTASSAFNGTIQCNRIGGALGGICTVVNSDVTMTTDSFKLKRIDIWCPTATSNSPTTTSVEWLGTSNSPNLEVSDTSINVSQPARISVRPPVNSLASFWQRVASSTGLFNLVCPAGSVIDMSVDYIEVDGAALNSSTVTTGVLGTQYWLALDGPVSNNLKPVSLSTTS